MISENEIGKIVVHEAIQLHKDLGPGFLESVYEEILAMLLMERGLSIKRQFGLPVYYNGKKLDIGFRADIVIENKVIIEIKSVEKLLPIHYKQLLNYLKVTDLKLGYVMNFNVLFLKDGLKRIVNNL